MPWSAPVTQSVSYDSIVSTTLQNTKATRYDAIFRKSAFFSWLHTQGRKELVDGGTKIQRAVEYDVNGTVASYEGYDPVSLTPQEPFTSLYDDLREIAGSITISRREERQNSGRAQIINLLTSKIENLDRSFGQKLNEMLLAPTGASLTAGNSGKDLNPLTVVIPFAGTGTLHNISTTGNSWWQSQYAPSASINDTALTLAGFKNELRNFYNKCSKHNDGTPDLVLTSQEVEEKYEQALEGQVRYGSTEMANLGFETVMLRRANVVWDQICPRVADNGSAYLLHDDGSADEHVAFFVNSDFLKLVVDTQTDLVNRPFMDSVDQTAKSALVLFMGNLFCFNRRTQGVITNITPASITG